MRKISVSRLEKTHKGRDFDIEYVKWLDSRYIEFPLSHIEFEYIKRTIDDYMYYIDGGGNVWSKIKYRDAFYYFSEDCQEWVFDEDMDISFMAYTEENEPMFRLVK